MKNLIWLLVFASFKFITVMAARQMLLQPVDWNSRPNNLEESELVGVDKSSVSKRNVPGYQFRRGHAPKHHHHSRKHSNSNQEPSSPSSKKIANKWGFNHGCEVICEKVLCFGIGPEPQEVCRQGRYRHRCCEVYRPSQTKTGAVKYGSPVETSIPDPVKVEAVTATHHPMIERALPPSEASHAETSGEDEDQFVANSLTIPTLPTTKRSTTTKHTTTKKPNTKSTTTSTKKSSNNKENTKGTTEKPKQSATTTTVDPIVKYCSNLTSDPTKCIEDHKCDFSCDNHKCLPATSEKPKNPKSQNNVCKFHYFCLLDECTCRKCDFAFDVAESFCVDHTKFCDDWKFARGFCGRPDQYYAHHGVICHNNKSKGNCHVEETILAVNLGTRGHGKYVDSKKYTYLSDDDVPYEEVFGTKHKWSGVSVPVHLPKELLANERVFYESIVHGDSRDKCLTYKIKLWEEGIYELAVKTLEPVGGKPKHRLFNVRFNGVEAMSEIDISTITRNRSQAAEIFLNFEVIRAGAELVVKGFPHMKILDGHVDLSFCYGKCSKISEHQDYQVAAFSVVRFSNEKDHDSKKCSSLKGNACDGRKYACQYNVVSGDSVPHKKCNKFWFTQHDCIRKGAFYAHGGMLCHNKDHSGGTCNISDVIMAVNLNGDKYGPDSRGIQYHSDKEMPQRDRKHTTQTTSVSIKSVLESHKLDNQLYHTYIHANKSLANATTNDCISWNIPVKNDGFYELSIKTGEHYHSTHGSRTFNIKINDEIVLQELDLLALGPKNTAVDIILNFEVIHRGSALHLRGYPLRPYAGKINLAFCYGGCKAHDINWIVAAFYVARFKDGKDPKKLYSL